MRPHHALAFSLVLSLAACDGSGTDVSGDASHDSSPSDGTTDGATDGTTDPVDTTPADVPVDPGLDPFADPPDAGYPPACGPDVCCTESPVDCIGAWQCVGDLCMWVCDDGGDGFHVVCSEDSQCDCFPAPVRCVGTWHCLTGTCWYFCDEG